MATITSTAAGNWSAGATWIGGVAPVAGDRAIIDHAVAVDVDSIIGDSPAEGTAVVTINTAGVLTVNAGIKLTVRGDLVGADNGSLTILAGSTYMFDASGAASPAATNYKIDLPASGFGPSANFTMTGTSGGKAIIDSDPGGGNGYIYQTSKGGAVSVQHAHIKNLGDSGHTNAFRFRPRAGNNLTIEDTIFDSLAGRVLLDESDLATTDNFNFQRVRFLNTSYSSNMLWYTSNLGAGDRNVIDVWFDKGASVSGSFEGWTISNTGSEGNLKSTSGSGTLATIQNIAIIEKAGSPGVFNTADCDGTVTNLYAMSYTLSPFHEGIVTNARAVYANGVAENAFSFVQGSYAPNLMTLSNTASILGYPAIQNFVFAKAGDGGVFGNYCQQKGTKNTRFKFTNNTGYLAASTANPENLYTGSGTTSNAFADQINSFDNNLLAVIGTPDVSNHYAVVALASQVITGTAQAGSSSTVVSTTSTLTTGVRSLENTYRVKITSGAAIGEVRTVSSNTASDFTVSPAFSVDVTGETFEAYPVDQITNARTNAFYNCPAQGTLYNADGTVATSAKRGYTGFYQTTPANVGATDIELLSAPGFVDTNRSLFTWPIKALGYSVGTAWATSTVYAVGDVVSKAVTGYYDGDTINYVCIQAHTSGTDILDGATGSWIAHWEPQGLSLLRDAVAKVAGYDTNISISALIDFVQGGYAPTNSNVSAAGYDGSDIGAVAYQAPAANQPIFRRRIGAISNGIFG